MTDLSVMEGGIGDDAKGVASEFRSAQSSELRTTTADLSRVSAQDVTGHADGYKNTEKIPSGDAKRIDAKQGSKL